jgi:hypothetical protein
MAQTIHGPFGLPSIPYHAPPTPCHTLFAPAGTGTGHSAEVELIWNRYWTFSRGRVNEKLNDS